MGQEKVQKPSWWNQTAQTADTDRSNSSFPAQGKKPPVQTLEQHRQNYRALTPNWLENNSEKHNSAVKEASTATSAQIQSETEALKPQSESLKSDENTSSSIQAKLAIGTPLNKYAPVADAMAGKVVTVPAPGNAPPVVRRSTSSEENKEQQIQAKPLADAAKPLVQREKAPSSDRETLQAKELKTQKESQKNLLEIILGGLAGEFNSDPSLGEIGVDFGVSIIPGLDQIADVRDLAAHLYFMLFKGEFNSPGRWVSLGFTLIGFIPEIGSVIKSISKLLTKGTKEALQHIDEILAVISRLLPGVSINRLRGLIAAHWDEGVSLGKRHWIDFINVLKNGIGWLPEIEQKGVALRQLDRVLAATDGKLSQAFAEVRRRIDEVLEEIGRRLDPNGNLASAGGPPLNRANSPQRQHAEPARIEGRGESSPSPRNNRFLNVWSLDYRTAGAIV